MYSSGIHWSDGRVTRPDGARSGEVQAYVRGMYVCMRPHKHVSLLWPEKPEQSHAAVAVQAKRQSEDHQVYPP